MYFDDVEYEGLFAYVLTPLGEGGESSDASPREASADSPPSATFSMRERNPSMQAAHLRCRPRKTSPVFALSLKDLCRRALRVGARAHLILARDVSGKWRPCMKGEGR